MNGAGQNAFHQEFPPNLLNIGAIGDTPPNFQARLDGYNHIDVLRMVTFYNETFGIVPQDNLGDRIDKFRRYLTEY